VQRLASRLTPGTAAAGCVFTACRFLIGRKGDERRAAQAIDEYVRWRTSLEKEPTYSPEVELAISQVYSPRLLEARDPRGRPVVVAQMGEIDIALAASRNVSISMLLRRHVSTLDRISAAIKASPEPLSGHLLIQDLAGCSVSKFVRARAFFKRALRLDQLYYPEMLGQMVCLRAPRLATWAFGQIKPWIDPTTAGKIIFAPDGPAEVLGGTCSPQLIDEIMRVMRVKKTADKDLLQLQHASKLQDESRGDRSKSERRSKVQGEQQLWHTLNCRHAAAAVGAGQLMQPSSPATAPANMTDER
jgi:hypothetical protein